jgi:MFS family permease
MGFAVNASTIGMAVAGLVVGLFSPHIDRRVGILASLLLLAIPTSLLAIAPNLAVFTTLRIMQGICMASAFTLTLAYLSERCSAMDAGGAFAAYITGNVASNLIGRLISATIAESLGIARNFYLFALLNLAGALLVYFTIKRVRPMHSTGPAQSPLSAIHDDTKGQTLLPKGLGSDIVARQQDRHSLDRRRGKKHDGHHQRPGGQP